MRKKLLLINPVNPCKSGLTINRSSRFPPLGLGIVAALTPSDWEIRLIDENFDAFRFEDADLVGITAFTSSAKRAYEIAAVYRACGTPAVMGGIHASMLPKEAEQFVSAVVVGEAESVWPKVIADFEAGKLEERYRGGLIDLSDMPKPRHDLFHPGYMFGAIQTARGCPMDCEFCSVTPFNGRKYRQRPVEDVLDELESIPQKMIFFVDDNLIGYGKKAGERATALFRGMITRGIKKDWFCQASINFAENEDVLKYAAKSGCRMVFLGLEADNETALEGINKRLNIKAGVNSYTGIIRRINRHKIAVLGAFIYGLDSDTAELLDRRTEYMINGLVDVMQTTILTPLPGTRLFEKLGGEDRLLYHDYPDSWSHYDMTEVTFKPCRMSAGELASAVERSRKRMYCRKVLLRKFVKTACATRSFVTAMWALSSNMNYAKVAHSLECQKDGCFDSR